MLILANMLRAVINDLGRLGRLTAYRPTSVVHGPHISRGAPSFAIVGGRYDRHRGPRFSAIACART